MLRIGNAHGFWGDRLEAAAEMLSLEPELDFITLDFLAEVSMSILATQRERVPQAGYARDVVEVVKSLVPYWKAGGKCRLITNAGGLDPASCARACQRALAEAGCRHLKIAVVTGDDVLELLRADAQSGAPSSLSRNLDTGEPIGAIIDRITTANAYLGGEAIAEALAQGAEIVITGRVADPSLAVGPCLHHFGWRATDWDRLAGATVAGHLIECGTQVTGGISTDWLEVPEVDRIGFPIVEVAEDGSCVVTKPGGTGGGVTEQTVKEQLVYEIGDPNCYLSPDVTVSFLDLQVEPLGLDRVRVSGAKGCVRPETYKVSATFRDGYWAQGHLTICGRDAVAKAQRCGELLLKRLQDAGCTFRDSIVECLGSGTFGPHASESSSRLTESVLRVAVASESKGSVERFARELMPFVTAGPPGTTGYSQGRPRVHEAFAYFPCLIARSAIRPRVELLDMETLP